MRILGEEGLGRLPADFQIIPLNRGYEKELLGIGLVFKKPDSAETGELIFLEDRLFYKAYLGCLYDAEQRVLNWLEIRVQQTAELLTAPIANRLALTNRILESRWGRQVRAMDVLLRDSLLKTGWESRPPLPSYVDLRRGEIIYPKDPASGLDLELCRDEVLLAEKQLPSFQHSLSRYLYVPALNQESPLFPVTSEVSYNSLTSNRTEIPSAAGDCFPFNPAAGFLLCTQYYPVDLETLFDLLSRSPRDCHRSHMTVPELFPRIHSLTGEHLHDAVSDRLFSEAAGLGGILPETFLLKLRLFQQLTSSVQTFVSQTKAPFFSLDSNSWRVDLLPPEPSLPSLWTVRVILTDPGESVSVTIPGTNRSYFACASTDSSIYHPSIASSPASGEAAVRIRKLRMEFGKIIAEGTFHANQPFHVNELDVVWLRLTLPHGTAELFVRLESDRALAQGEWRFQSLPSVLEGKIASDLQEAEGVPLFHVPFEAISHLNTPSDLYSLAVLAMRLFFVNSRTTLPVVLDEMLSLTQQLSHCFNSEVPLAARIEMLFAQDARWAHLLGPQHLMDGELSAEEAFQYIPAALWWQFLAILVPMFPGVGPDSEFAAYGDLPFETPELAFTRTLECLSLLRKRARALIFSDWNQNRQVREVIESFLAENS